jgi:hypothetical protein
MKKLALVLALLTPLAYSGTVYVDRPVPIPIVKSTSCLIKLDNYPQLINAVFVTQVSWSIEKIANSEGWKYKDVAVVRFYFLLVA